jgi:hypothetical protein
MPTLLHIFPFLKRLRYAALEEAARRFEQGDGKLLSQYEVARILRAMK